MDTEKLVNEVAAMLNDYAYPKQVGDYLASQGVDETGYEAILQSARIKLAENRARHFAKKNKRKFFIWLSLLILTLVFFLFVLPYGQIAGSITILSLIGTALVCFFSYLVIAYNKTWEKKFVEEHEQPSINYSFLPMFAIPGVVIYFIFSWRLSSGQDQVLKQSHETTTGTIVAGSSVKTRRADFSDVTVEFETKEGRMITATEDVTSYQFKNFYVGQKVKLIYSKDDPQNIDLLLDDEKVKELTGSEERDILPADLVRLMNANSDSALNILNEIKYGWQYDGKKYVLSGRKNAAAIMIKPNEIVSLAKGEYLFTYPAYLLKMGFIQTNKPTNAANLTAKKIFEKEGYLITITLTPDNVNSVTTISKK